MATARSPLLDPERNLSSNSNTNSQNNSTNTLLAAAQRVQSLAAQVGTEQDGPLLRRELREAREAGSRAARRALDELREAQKNRPVSLSGEAGDSRAALRSAFARLQNASEESIRRERLNPHVKQHRNSSAFNSGSVQNIDQIVLEQRERRREESAGAVLASGQAARSGEDEIIEERNREMRKMEKELMALKDVFVEVSSLIGDQGERIDVIDAHVTTADVQAQEAVEQLRKAQEYQQRSRLKACGLVLIVVLALGGLIGFLYWLTGAPA